MIPHIPNQRHNTSGASKPFNNLVSYIKENKGLEIQPIQAIDPSENFLFSDLLNYATSPTEKLTNTEKCLAIRTHGVTSLATAAIEMNAVSMENHRCIDPAYHFILSWPEHEKPESNAIFDAAEHAIKALQLGEHQYVIAIHGNTDNRHCHIAVNRIHPTTFKSRNIEWAQKNLHLAARQSEIKHGWSHDNGIYIVETNAHGKKIIVPNKAHDVGQANQQYPVLPAWHDPAGLDAWLKTTLSRKLKRALPDLQSWQALHGWLDNYDITLKDSGGGGMKVTIASPTTGEIIDLPASKAFRFLKRADLEQRWGAFSSAIDTPCSVPDLSHLTPKQIAKGVNRVLDNPLGKLDRTPYDHLANLEQHRSSIAAQRGRGLHELPSFGLETGWESGEVLLPDDVHHNMGEQQDRQDNDVRRPELGQGSSGTGLTPRGRTRDDSKREERREQRALDRADLRLRYAQYKRFIRQEGTGHTATRKEYQQERKQALDILKTETRQAKQQVRCNKHADTAANLLSVVAIEAESGRRKLQIEARYQQQMEQLRIARLPAIGWRVWLHEQAGLGDQAALSALRGIVYQAQRDAKKPYGVDEDVADHAKDMAWQDAQYHKAVARLIEEEKQETAIRAARFNMMRPYEADALLARYSGMQWRVTGNGNVEFSDLTGDHLFTDRGNRVTFDRALVTDDDIQLALVHAQQKFGSQLLLTGEDLIFSKRMACMADRLGITILNPELQETIKAHRVQREQMLLATNLVAQLNVSHAEQEHSNLESRTDAITALQAKVLSIDPHAAFVSHQETKTPVLYVGAVAATYHADDVHLFAQYIGRGKYMIHQAQAPDCSPSTIVEVNYLANDLKIKAANPEHIKNQER